MKEISEVLDQYTGICKEAIMDSAAKLSKSFEKVIIEVLLLYMVIPGRINFTQLGKYGRHREQCYRQNFGRLRSKSLNWLRFNVDMSRMLPIFVDGLPGIAYTLIAYSKALKCKVRLVIWIMPDKKRKLFFSTDTTLSGEEVLDFYRTRFQIEFCFRDAKQIYGLTDSQTRDTNKLDCAFNASFASLNVVKVMMKERGTEYSMSNFKLLMTNTFLTKRIFDVSRYRPNQTLINSSFASS